MEPVSVREASERIESVRPVEVAPDRRDAALAQHGYPCRAAHQRVDPVAPQHARQHAQRNIAAANDQ